MTAKKSKTHEVIKKARDLLDKVLTDEADTLDRAADLTNYLNLSNDLLGELRVLRSLDVSRIHDNQGMSYAEIGKHIGVKPERASAIARLAPSGKDLRKQREEGDI